MTIDDLYAALVTEFAGDVHIYETLPSTFSSPSVIVTPSEPFLETGNHGNIRERWKVLVTSKATGPDRGTAQLRKNSLRVRDCLGEKGAVWQSTSQPAFAGDSTSVLVVVNEVELYYQPSEILGA